MYTILRYTIMKMDPLGENNAQEGKKAAAAAVLRRLDRRKNDEDDNQTGESGRRQKKEDLALNQYEAMIAMDVVAPDDIPTKFDGE